MPRGRGVRRSRSAPVLALSGTSETTAAAEDDSHLVVEDILATLRASRGGDLDHGCAALVDDLEEPGPREQLGGRGEGPLADLQELLAVEEHHGGEVGDDGIVVEGHLGVEGRDDAECRQDLEVLGALKDVLELGALGTETQVVQDHITLLILVLRRSTLFREGLGDGIEVLIAGSLLGLQSNVLATELIYISVVLHFHLLLKICTIWI